MKLALPRWLRSADAPLSDLEEQLAGATADLQTAQEACEAARLAHKRSGTPSDRQAYLEAQQGVAGAQADLDRAKELIADAEQQQKLERRAELERQLATLDAELATDPKSKILEAEEAAAFDVAVAKKLARRAHNQARIDLMQKRLNVHRELGHEVQALYAHDVSPEPSHYPVAERLRALSAGIATSEPRCLYLNALANIQF